MYKFVVLRTLKKKTVNKPEENYFNFLPFRSGRMGVFKRIRLILEISKDQKKRT